MGRFINGKDLEVSFRNRLETVCEMLPNNLHFDLRYKLDLVVSQFKGVDKLISLGVQLTAKWNDAAKQEEFLNTQEKSLIVSKAAYIEIDSKVDLEQGAAIVASSALTSFVFSHEYQRQKVIGIRIYKDLTYEMFPLKENIQKLKREQRRNCQHQQGNALSGEIIYLSDRGYGFIKSSENGMKTFFFHIREVDGPVASQLQMLEKQNGGRGPLKGLSVPVAFEDGGMTKAGEKRPEALNVRLLNPFPESNEPCGDS